MRKESVRKECLQVLESILPLFKLEILESVIDERETNGFYHEEKNVSYPDHKPFFIAEIGVKDKEKHSFFKGKFYVYGEVSIIEGYKAESCNQLMERYYSEITAKQEQNKVKKRNFKLIEDVYV